MARGSYPEAHCAQASMLGRYDGVGFMIVNASSSDSGHALEYASNSARLSISIRCRVTAPPAGFS